MFRQGIALISIVLILTGCGLIPAQPDGSEWFTSEPGKSLAEAVADGDQSEIAQLVSDGADPDTVGTEDLTLLQWSMMTNSIDGMAGLLVAGANPNLKGRVGSAPLEDAVFVEDPPFVTLLLSAGADPNGRTDVTNSTALDKACKFPNLEIFTALLDAGADPDLADNNNDGPLHSCSRTNQGDLLLLMLQRGADPLVTNSHGASFQDYYFNYPPKEVLNERALAQRVTIIQWLEENDIPVNPEASQFR